MDLDFMTDFSWQNAPLNSIQAPIAAGACYLLVVTLIYNCRPTKTSDCVKDLMQTVQAYHNLFLCFWSLAMVIGGSYEVYKRYTSEGLTWFVCEDPKTQSRGALFWWSYVYYISKYYELLDTVIVLIKGSTPPHFFLHVYHHSVVVYMAWLWLEVSQTLQFGGLLFNAFVHVIMYYYYYLLARGIRPTWKNMVTRVQIVQFMSSLLLLCPTLYSVYNKGWYHCAGMNGVVFNCIFNLTLLFQFSNVLFINKKKAAGKKLA